MVYASPTDMWEGTHLVLNLRGYTPESVYSIRVNLKAEVKVKYFPYEEVGNGCNRPFSWLNTDIGKELSRCPWKSMLQIDL